MEVGCLQPLLMVAGLIGFMGIAYVKIARMRTIAMY